MCFILSFLCNMLSIIFIFLIYIDYFNCFNTLETGFQKYIDDNIDLHQIKTLSSHYYKKYFFNYTGTLISPGVCASVQ